MWWMSTDRNYKGVEMSDDYPANEMESTADLFQWILRLDEMVAIAGQRINARYTASALRDLVTASHGENPHEVRLAWQLLLDTIGPVLTGKFIATGAWKDFCPEPDHDEGTPSLAVLWRKHCQSVIGRVQFTKDRPTGVRFDVESKVD